MNTIRAIFILMGEGRATKRKGLKSVPELIAELPFCIVHAERRGPQAVQINCVFEEGA